MKHETMFKNHKYQLALATAAGTILSQLIEEYNPFAVKAALSTVSFYPALDKDFPIPEDNGLVLFTITNHSLNTFMLHDNYTCSFEAGFGDNPAGPTIVTISLFGIYMLIKDNTLFINPSAIIHGETFGTEGLNDDLEKKKKTEEEGIKKSHNIFMNNPENKKLFSTGA